MIKKAELLSPAGDWDSLIAAVNAGCDAVYLAGNAYGARAYAKNFSENELLNAIDYLHLLNKKIYLTINTLTKSQELETLPEFLAPFYKQGLDGVIVQDVGVLRLLKDKFPGLELHGSTQMTVTSPYGARLLKEFGLERIVPARELSVAELSAIKNCGIEVEAFIHGAMCYCYSGQCLMSSMIGGRSGNRGRCAGPCRLPYRAYNDRRLPDGREYILSLKDLCTINSLPELLSAGIDSLKIEGRMKSPEYVAFVTSLYRKYMDRYYNGHNTTVEKKDLDTLEKLFVRGNISEGYLHKRNGADMVTLIKPGYNGADDMLMNRLNEIYVKNPLCRTVKIRACISVGNRLQISVYDDEFYGESLGGIVETANTQPAVLENIKEKLNKLGGTYLKCEDIDVYLEDNCFVNVKELNECRRQAVSAYKEAVLKAYRR